MLNSDIIISVIHNRIDKMYDKINEVYGRIVNFKKDDYFYPSVRRIKKRKKKKKTNHKRKKLTKNKK